MKNLLSDLEPDQVCINIDDDPTPVMQASVGGQASDQGFLDDFFQNVEELKNIIQSIKDATDRITVLSQRQEVEVNKQKEKDNSNELTRLVLETNRAAQQGKSILQFMKEDAANGKPSEKRIKSNLFTTLTRKFVAVTQDYQNAQNSYKTGVKKKVKRTVRTVMSDASDQEIEAVLASGGSAGDVLAQAILHRPAAVIENAYNSISDKYQDVIRLEASIKELHQMFLDFALLVEQQGELLDRIQNQVETAYDDFEVGNENIEKAIEHSKTARKKQCCIIVIVVVIVIILLFALGVFS